MKTLSSRKSWLYAGIDYDYDYTHNCSSYGCNEDGICRCGEIIDARVESVDVESIADYVMDGKKDPLLKYCIERILVTNKIYEDHHWYLDVGPGYYGDEINGISLESANEFDKKLNHLFSLQTDSERIRYALIEEYGYLLEVIKDLEFSIEKVSRDDIKIPNDHYHAKITPDSYSMYVDKTTKPGPWANKIYQGPITEYAYSYKGPACVVREDDDGNLILVDGYHRYTALQHRKRNRKINVIVGRKSSNE